MAKFRRLYSEEQNPKEYRDRFQVELSTTEREILTRETLTAMQEAIWEHQDAAAVKFWARYGWLAYSTPGQENALFRDVLFKNSKRKDRIGVNVPLEVSDKFQTKKAETGGNMERPSRL